MTLLEIVEAAAAWPSGARLQEAAENGVAAWEVVTPYDVVGFPWMAVVLAAWILTSLWLSRARQNAIALCPTWEHKRSAVWAWLGWWVPVVSLWFPFQVVSDVRGAGAGPDARPGARSGTVLGWWWALWLVYMASSRIAPRIAAGTDPDPDLVALLGPVETFNAVVAVAAVALWLRLVKEIDRDQRLLASGRAR